MGAASNGEGRRVSGKWETGGLQNLLAAGALAFVLQGNPSLLVGLRGRLIQSLARRRCAVVLGGQEKRGRRLGPSAVEEDTTCALR